MEACAVIGSGITGMSAALLLASQGYAVHLIEKSRNIAPLLRGFHRDGIHFETGFHFAGGLGTGGILESWLKFLGLDLPYGHLIPEREIVCLEDGRHVIPQDAASLMREVRDRHPASAAGAEALLDEIQSALAQNQYLAPDAAVLPSDRRLFASAATVSEKLASLIPDAPLRETLSARCLLYGVSPEEAAWTDFLHVAGPYFHSSASFPGGSLTILNAFETALAQKDIAVVTGAAAVRISTRGSNGVRHAAGVTLDDGRTLDAERIVFTGHPDRVVGLLPPGSLKPAYLRHLAAFRETPMPFIIYGAADETVPASTCWYIPFPGQDAPLSRDSVFCVLSGEEQDDGRKSCIVIGTAAAGRRILDMDGEEYGDFRQIMLAKLKKLAEKHLPELEGHWKIADVSTGKTLRRWIFGSEGGIYGLAHTAGVPPLPPLTKIRGLALAGQSILLPGLLGCVISAALACDAVLGKQISLGRLK